MTQLKELARPRCSGH